MFFKFAVKFTIVYVQEKESPVEGAEKEKQEIAITYRAVKSLSNKTKNLELFRQSLIKRTSELSKEKDPKYGIEILLKEFGLEEMSALNENLQIEILLKK